MAITLRKLGVYRVRPLHGGFETWRDKGYPLVDFVPDSMPTKGLKRLFSEPNRSLA